MIPDMRVYYTPFVSIPVREYTDIDMVVELITYADAHRRMGSDQIPVHICYNISFLKRYIGIYEKNIYRNCHGK